MKKETWASQDTCVYFGDGRIDIRHSPDAFNRARLIASAPDLLAALELIKDKVWQHIEINMFDEEIAQIEAAIAKARGQ